MPQVVLMKLVSGEEVIGKIVSETETELLLEDVRVLVMQPTGPGQVGIGMLPWIATAPDDEHPIKLAHIMRRLPEVPKQLEDGYLQQTSGIQFASGIQM